jgi:hypothetical protein
MSSFSLRMPATMSYTHSSAFYMSPPIFLPWMNHSRYRGRAVLGVGLWLYACWKYGFESRWGHGCLSVGGVVCCQVQVSATGWSFVQWCPRVTQCDLRRADSSSRGVLVSLSVTCDGPIPHPGVSYYHSVWPAMGRFLFQGCHSITQCDQVQQ